MNYTVITAPASEPVTLVEAKTHLRIPTAETGEDSYITSLISVATNTAENILGKKLITQTLDLFYDKFPACREFDLPFGKLQSVTHIKYYDVDNVERTLSSSIYQTDSTGLTGRIKLEYGESFPDTRAGKLNSVAIRMIVGYGVANSVPTSIKQALLLLIANWFENREPALQGTLAQVPYTVELLLASHRLYFF